MFRCGYCNKIKINKKDGFCRLLLVTPWGFEPQ